MNWPQSTGQSTGQSIGQYTIIPYPSEYPSERGVTALADPHKQVVREALRESAERMTNEALQREADRSFGEGTVTLNGAQQHRQVSSLDKIKSNNQKFNELFKDSAMYGNIANFEKQVLKNDYPEDKKFMNGVGYWEAVLQNFITEGSKPQYGFGNTAAEYQDEFMKTELGKNIEKKLKGYYKRVRIENQTRDKQLFHSAIQDMVEGIPKYWWDKALKKRGLRGGSKKFTTRKYKNRKLSYRRYNKNRTTKNKRRYSRRK